MPRGGVPECIHVQLDCVAVAAYRLDADPAGSPRMPSDKACGLRRKIETYVL